MGTVVTDDATLTSFVLTGNECSDAKVMTEKGTDSELDMRVKISPRRFVRRQVHVSRFGASGPGFIKGT